MGGRVVAVDIRRLPLLFLRIRTFLRNQHNISVVHATASDPGLPVGSIDAVLIANTYHEFSNSKAMLAHILRSLVPGGRLVVVDRSPESINPQHYEGEVGHRYLLSATVESELLQTGFKIINRQDHFIEEPAKESWWLIVAGKP
jgi:ubiquinone/menaquinone biosynthesis C-methylase UbiE